MPRIPAPEERAGLVKLPNAEQAIVESRKITHYLLSETHPDGKSKENFFSRFGFIPTGGKRWPPPCVNTAGSTKSWKPKQRLGASNMSLSALCEPPTAATRRSGRSGKSTTARTFPGSSRDGRRVRRQNVPGT